MNNKSNGRLPLKLFLACCVNFCCSYIHAHDELHNKTDGSLNPRSVTDLLCDLEHLVSLN